MTECKTHFSIVAGFSESGVSARLADHDGGRPTTERCGVRGSDARSQCECQDTGLLESGDDHKPRLALPVTRGSERCIAHPTAGVFLAESHPPGFAAGTAKIMDISARRVRRSDNNTFFWQRTVVVEIDVENGWRTRVLDQGYNEVTTVLGFPTPILTGLGRSPVPLLLNGSGVRLAVDATPVYLEFDFYRTEDWSGLSLDY